MTAWGDLIDNGYRRILGVTIEGIPYAFLETLLLKTDDSAIVAPAPLTTVRGALRVRDSDAISQELDRQSGLGRGRALDLVLALDVLRTANLESLFRVPSLRARVTSDVNGVATTFPVDSTSGWPASGSFYIGREYVTYSGTTATSFTGCTRAVGGFAHYHPSGTSSGYRFATDRPQYWRGRLVTLWEHLVGPDGRAIAGVACEVGSYCRELWKGYVDAQPQVDGRQMLLRCLPVERLFAQELGGTSRGEVVFAQEEVYQPTPLNGYYPIVVTPTDSVYVQDVDSGTTTVYRPAAVNTLSTISTFMEGLRRWVSLTFTGLSEAHLSLRFEPGDDTKLPRYLLLMRFEEVGLPRPVDFVVRFDTWFLTGLEAGTTRAPVRFEEELRTDSVLTYPAEVNPNDNDYAWLLIRPESESDGELGEWPGSGYAVLEAEEGVEVVAFDAVNDTIDPTGQLIAVKLSQRALMGTRRLNPFVHGARLTVIPGARGTISEVLETIATSSGTGTRGTRDTLGYGLGLALPEDWLDVDIFPLSSQFVDGASDDKASIERTLGGWLALMGRCLTQRQQADGRVRIVAASTSIEVAGIMTEVLPRDVLINSTKAERLFESPNVVRIEDNLRDQRTVSVIRDVPRQQAEGAREVTFVAPGINTASALIYGGKMLALADGQLVVTMGVRSGLPLGVGDLCLLKLEHPAIWDWTTGAVAQSVPARVVGASENLGTGARTLTFLVPGQQQAALTLCPAARVDGYLSSFTLEVDDTTGFAAGMAVSIYRRGDEAATATTRTVSAVGSNSLTLTVSLSSVTYPADGDTWVTYIDYPSGTDAQDVHLYMGQGSFSA